VPAYRTLIVIGATGDLTGRLLLPALARLHQAQELGVGFRLVGASPQQWDQRQFVIHARTALAAHAPDLPPTERESLLLRLEYQQLDVTDSSSLDRLFQAWGDSGELTLYLALPTHLLAATVAALRTSAHPPTMRIAVEKPFGVDLDTAVALNAALTHLIPLQRNIFRVDHVLGMERVQNLTRAITQLPSWSGQHNGLTSNIEQVSILWEETLALEGRAMFYDGAGALKDVLQNHLLQILCLIAMADPGRLVEEGGKTDRLAALKAVQVPTAAAAVTSSRRARYSAGRLAALGGGTGRAVPDYIAEDGVDPGRNTETFAEVSFRVDLPVWADTVFVLRAGKALSHRRRGVCIRFREIAGTRAPDVWIDVDDASAAPPAVSAAEAGSAPLEQLAYVNVLRCLLSGSDTLFVTAEETELAWALFAPIMRCWADNQVPLGEYPAGTSY